MNPITTIPVATVAARTGARHGRTRLSAGRRRRRRARFPRCAFTVIADTFLGIYPAARMPMPAQDTFIAGAVWASIGASVGAAVGASRPRRQTATGADRRRRISDGGASRLDNGPLPTRFNRRHHRQQPLLHPTRRIVRTFDITGITGVTHAIPVAGVAEITATDVRIGDISRRPIRILRLRHPRRVRRIRLTLRVCPATPGTPAITAPIPNATANAPTRPTYRAELIAVPPAQCGQLTGAG